MPVVDRAVTVRLAGDVTYPPNCDVRTGSGIAPMSVAALRLSYAGAEATPATVAEFLPPALTSLTIYVPADADASVRAAAVSLTGAVAGRYQPAPVAIRVRPLAGGSADTVATGFLTRSIVITGTGDAGLKLVPTSGLPTLQISGDPTQLPLQIAALTRDIGKLAQASAATATRTQALPGLAEGRQSIDQLGIGTPSATGVAAATVTLGLSQVQLGSDAQALTLRLIGSTSLPGRSADGAAVLTASVAGRVLSRLASRERLHLRPDGDGAVVEPRALRHRRRHRHRDRDERAVR